MSGSTSTSQSATPPPYNVTPPVWNDLPTYSVASAPVSTNSVSSEYHTENSGNNVNDVNNVNNVNTENNEVVYNPPNYINIPHQTNTGSYTGYTTSIPSGGINPQITYGKNFQRTQNGQIIGGQAWPNQSALGRFICQSPGWTSNKTTGGVKKQKRIRTAFTSQQMMELEQEYSRTRYLDRTRRIELAEILRLNERTIKIWFQNRRMKEKKDRAESLEDSEEVSTSESSPEIGDAQMPMLINEQYSGMKNNVYNQSEIHYQGNIYVQNYPATSTPVQMSMTSLPLSMPGTSLPPSMPAMSLPHMMPKTSLSHMMPATSLPLSMPATGLPTSMPVTSLPPSMSMTGLPPSMPATGLPTSMPATSLPPSMPAMSLPHMMPATSLPHMMPATSLPLSMSATGLPTSMPVTSLPPSMPVTSLPPSMPATGLPPSMPATSLPPSMPMTGLPPSMPAQTESAQNMYQTYMMEEQCQAQYQQLHLQMQPCQSSYNEVQELKPKDENTSPNANGDNIENNWDLSWIRSSISYEN